MKLVNCWDYTEMHGQQNVKKKKSLKNFMKAVSWLPPTQGPAFTHRLVTANDPL